MSVCVLSIQKAWGKQWESTSNLWSLMITTTNNFACVHLLLLCLWCDDFPPSANDDSASVTHSGRDGGEKKTQNTCDLPLRQWLGRTFLFSTLHNTHTREALSFEPATMDVVRVSTQCLVLWRKGFFFFHLFFFLFELWQTKNAMIINVCRQGERERVSW